MTPTAMPAASPFFFGGLGGGGLGGGGLGGGLGGGGLGGGFGDGGGDGYTKHCEE